MSIPLKLFLTLAGNGPRRSHSVELFPTINYRSKNTITLLLQSYFQRQN